MTDIEFTQIRAGQTVRVHYGYSDSDTKATAEGVVASIDPAGGLLRPRRASDLVLGAGHGRALPADARITRVELLAEPAPKWKGGQLAELTWRDDFGEGTHTAVMAWSGDFWCPLAPGKIVRPGWVVGEPRLMVVVPADSRVVTQDCVVLPPVDPNGCAWQAARLRRYAQSGFFGDEHPYAHDLLLQIADAIEEAQR